MSSAPGTMGNVAATREASPNDARDVNDFSRRVVFWQAWIGAFLLILLPLFNLLHPTNFHWQATLHAVFAISMVVLGSYAGHHALYVARGSRERIPKLRKLTYWSLGVVMAAIGTGNWAYMPYRGTGGARARLMDSAPFFHSVLMECKEFICLLPLPLFAGAAFLFWYYGSQVERDTRVASTISILLLAAWAFLLAGAVMGISIAKVQFL